MKKLNFTILKKFLVFITILFNVLTLTSQETQHKNDFKHFRISPVLSHTYIPMATNDGDKIVIVPSIGLDLEYWLNDTWGFGFHNDLELETFEVKSDNKLSIEKEFPIVVTIDALYKLNKNWIIVFGTGVEFEKNENLFIVRTGIEYEVEFGNHWDVAPTIFYDYRSRNFGTWSIGIGIGKRF